MIIRKLEDAYKFAAQAQSGDPDWTFRVVDIGNGNGIIVAYDEDGEEAGRGL